ncbi:MAG: hypothetical protein ACK5YH_05435 [Pseudanabaena sp.]
MNDDFVFQAVLVLELFARIQSHNLHSYPLIDKFGSLYPNSNNFLPPE